MAGKIFKNQDYLRVELYTGIDITGATALIKYSDPNGDEGSWTATISDESNGTIYYDLLVGDTLGISGTWIFWAHITFSDTRVAIGESFTEFVYDEGS